MFKYTCTFDKLLQNCYINLVLQSMQFKTPHRKETSAKLLATNLFSGLTIVFSDASPQLFNNKNSLTSQFDGKIDIDELLGCYLPQSNEIILYYHPIVEFARLKQFDVGMLTTVVALHEIGHFVCRHGFNRLQQADIDRLAPTFSANGNAKKLENYSPWPLNNYDKTDTRVHELLAQLYCKFAINGVDQNLNNTFLRLTEYQNDKYLAFKMFPNMSLPELISCNKKLIGLNRPAGAADVGDIFEEHIENMINSLDKLNLPTLRDFFRLLEPFKNERMIKEYKTNFFATKYGLI